jgi:large subunit ribosomal protein L4|tara:strand:- start:502 stop:1155 length:654 start_codon:yes stop_codon:yes gene_type:complete
VELSVINNKGEEISKVEVSNELVAIDFNESVVHQAVVRQLANARQGTSSTKTRSEVSGGGIKPRIQKHSGRARQGSIRAPQWKGGGVVFGPKPRSYGKKITKKMKQLAIRSSISDKVREEKLMIIDSFDEISSKTKDTTALLSVLGISQKILIVTQGKNDNMLKATGNIKNIKLIEANKLNVVDIVTANNMLISLDGIKEAERIWVKDHQAQEVSNE